jgi:hypothetical protein
MHRSLHHRPGCVEGNGIASGPVASGGLLDGKSTGQPSKLNDTQRQAIARMIESGPIPAVHGVVRLVVSWLSLLCVRSWPYSARAFKGIICGDISEFESHMPSHALSLWGLFEVETLPRQAGREKQGPPRRR